MKKRNGIIASILCVAMLVSGLVVGQFDGMNKVEAETTTEAVPAYRVGWPTDSNWTNTYQNATLFSTDEVDGTMTNNTVKTSDDEVLNTIGATKWGVSEALFFDASKCDTSGMLSVFAHPIDLGNGLSFKDYYNAKYTPSSMSFYMSRFESADIIHQNTTSLEMKNMGMYIVYAVSEPNQVETTGTYTKYETTLYCADLGIDRGNKSAGDYVLMFRNNRNITVTEYIYADGTDSRVELNKETANSGGGTRIDFENEKCTITGDNPNEYISAGKDVDMYEMFQVTLSYGDADGDGVTDATNPIFNICAKYQVDGTDKEFSVTYKPAVSITGKKAAGFRANTSLYYAGGLYIADPKVTYDISSYTGDSLPQAVGSTLATKVEDGSVKSRMQFNYTAAQTQLSGYSDISYGAVLTRTKTATTYDTLVNEAINQIEGSKWKSAESYFIDSGYTVTKRTGDTLPNGYYVTVSNSEKDGETDTSGYRTSTLGYVIGKNPNGAVEYYFTEDYMNHSVVSLLKAIFNELYLPQNCTVSADDGTYDGFKADSLLQDALNKYNSDKENKAELADILEAAGEGSTSNGATTVANGIPKRTLLKSLHYNLYSNESTSN